MENLAETMNLLKGSVIVVDKEFCHNTKTLSILFAGEHVESEALVKQWVGVKRVLLIQNDMDGETFRGVFRDKAFVLSEDEHVGSEWWFIKVSVLLFSEMIYS